MGKVEDDQHQHVADHEGGLKSQAQLLVELGVLPVREVAAYIRVHIVGVIQALFEESEGIFKLILGEIPDRGFSVRIPVPELLFGGVKHIRSYETLEQYLEPVESQNPAAAGPLHRQVLAPESA
jgi:hypothetical protein